MQIYIVYPLYSLWGIFNSNFIQMISVYVFFFTVNSPNTWFKAHSRLLSKTVVRDGVRTKKELRIIN